MLVLSVRQGDTTLITTPSGEIISIVMLETGRNFRESRVGITAPTSYQILRDDLHTKELEGLKATQVFLVYAFDHGAEVVVADQQDQALEYYRQRYPERRGPSARLIKDYARYEWYSRLKAAWLQGKRPPFGLED